MQLSAFARDAGFQIAWSIARRMGVIPHPGFELAFQAQVQREVGDAPDSLGRVNNNPLNLTAPSPTYWQGQTGWASGGSAVEHHTDFAVFGTLTDGVEAAAQNYMAGTYAGVRAAIAAMGDAVAIAGAIAASPWDSGHYPQLVDQVRELEATTQGGTADMTAPEIVAAIKADPALAQELYDALAPIIQQKVVAPEVDTEIAIKKVQTDLAAAIAAAVAPDNASVEDQHIAGVVLATLRGLFDGIAGNMPPIAPLK